ncbi:MAG: squalene synthase HpnC [Quisquiliibacterium sp.]
MTVQHSRHTEPSAPVVGGWVSSVRHYENFPVASVLMPAELRPAVIAIYRFARYADDVADEGNAEPQARIRELHRLRDALLGKPGKPGVHPLVVQLQPWIERFALPVEPFLALLSAFEQDVCVHRFATRAALLDYCVRSANPIGRLLLHLYRVQDPQSITSSDAICTALQLINFVQDITSDWSRGRVYIALDELTAAGLTIDEIERAVAAGRASPRLREVIATQAEQAHALLESGASLVSRVPLRLALELRGVLAGATRVLQRLSASDWDPILRRPKLGWADAPAIARLMISRPRRLR